MTYQSSVFSGAKLGRTIGFPTLNLDPQVLPPDLATGVYTAEVTHRGKKYRGLLFFGPKKTFDEVKNSLEIYLIDFTGEIYGQTVSFQIGKWIRPARKFGSIEELKRQLQLDLKSAQLN